jgi:hypothetical protein
MGISKPSQACAKHQKDMAVLYFGAELNKGDGQSRYSRLRGLTTAF